MRTNAPLGHEQLLTLARKTEAAARDGDRDRLEGAVLRLFEALVDHVDAERPALLRLPPGDARMIQRGQQRLIDMLVELAVEVETPGSRRWHRAAQHLLVQLTLQADDERQRLAATSPP